MKFAPAFTSLFFPPDRSILTLNEVASRWRCTDQHILDLVKEGQLEGIDLSAPGQAIRMPVAAIDALAERTGIPREELLRLIASFPIPHTPRARVRIPSGGYHGFMRSNQADGAE